MSKPPTCPCKGCKDRTAENPEQGTEDCHKDCQKYAEWKEKDWAFKGIRYREKHNEINSYITERRREHDT